MNYRGMSLRFARTIKGDPSTDSYPDCHTAIDALNPQKDPDQGVVVDPPLGSYVWFRNEHRGDVGLAVGSGRMLCLDATGRADLHLIRSGEPHGTYVGYTSKLRPEEQSG